MKFPRINKKPEDLLEKDLKRLAVSRNVVFDVLLLLTFVFRSYGSAAAAVPLPSSAPEQKIHSSTGVPIKTIRIGRAVLPYLELLNAAGARIFPAQYDNHYSHYSHYSHESHYSHYSHYSSSVPTPPVSG
jgi:hypothetical protein